MPIYSKESLDTLRQRIDLADVISSHIDMKGAGSSYKGLCPFHDEKTPSFMIQKGDTHYHCFGCGAHGDAIQFLMIYLKMGFGDAVESLAERFHVHLDIVEGKEEYKGPSKKLIKLALDKASHFFHFCLLHTPDGQEALHYLYQRGIDLEFIRQFQVGYAPKNPGMLRKIMHEQKVSDEVLEAAGLIANRSSGGYRDFFYERITFPIHHPTGSVIGFSARKFKEDTFGGKYVNTPETPVFKKSRVLFALNYCRRRIAKDRKVIVVEGQIDALRLIHSGFNFTVAGQGTAFGEGHVKEMMALGVNQVFLALDPDAAGMEAAVKIGNLFQKEGAEVLLIDLPSGSDPDTFLRQQGSDAFLELMKAAKPYLDFLVTHHARGMNIQTPAGKNELVQILTKQIREWKHSLMIHESLARLATLLQIPGHLLGVGQDYNPNIYIKKSASVGLQTINPDQILESDFLRWLMLVGCKDNHFSQLAIENVKGEDLFTSPCNTIYKAYLQRIEKMETCDLLSLMNNEEDQIYLSELMEKKVNLDKAEDQFPGTIQKILDRNWMQKRELIKQKIQGGQCSDEEVLLLLKEFDTLQKKKPLVKLCETTSVD